jgi:hypothetical protein
VTAKKKRAEVFVILLCEGACNPDLGGLDVRVRAERNRLGIDQSGPIPDGPVLAAVQRLIHTRHRHTRANRYTCIGCGTERQYGH